MNNPVKFDNAPTNSVISRGFGKIDYCDSFQISKNTTDSIETITASAFSVPKWVGYLMKIRNSIVGIFGLKIDDNKDKNRNIDFTIGSRAGIFQIIDKNENEIVLGENDKHLNFRTSVLIVRKESLSEIYLTTIVKFNNIWGRLYFLPVKPFHKIIVKSLLKNI